MNIKKPTKAELMAWLKDNSLDHGTYVFIPASKVADMPATSIGDLLKEWANKPVTPADYVFDPKTATITDHYRKLALDFRADRNSLREENEILKKKHTQEYIAASKVRVENLILNKHITEHAYRIADMKRAINEKTDLIARLRGCLDKERDAYARLAKRVERMRVKFPMLMESIDSAMDDEEAGE
jgi:Mg2+ and Co2+ transporter CorA